MISESNNGMYMPVAPAYGNGGGFMNGGDGWWIILLLLACGGGWGGFGGMGGMMGMGMMDNMWSFPWILAGQNNLSGQMSDGFRDQMLNTSLNSIQNGVTSGFGDVQTALCGGFAGVNASINGAQNALAQQLYTNQISDLERSFAAQTANTAALSGLSQQLSTCCCENRAGIADLKYTVASEACADRAALQAGIQTILDKMCQQELDAERRDNQNLRSELMYARGQASQVAQTAAIEASQSAQTQYIVNRVAPYPIPAYVVPNPVGTGTTTGGTT